MSEAFVRELDYKMQQVREYALIAHGYHNENLQYPVHVRRSHDGEKVTANCATLASRSDIHQRQNHFSTDSTILNVIIT